MEPEERNGEQTPNEKLPWQQLVFDDVFLLIMAGLVTPTLFYIVWGLWSLNNVEFFAP